MYMYACSHTRGAWQQSLSKSVRTLSAFRYFPREMCVSTCVSVCKYTHSRHHIIGIFFFSWGLRTNGLFVVIREIALGLHAIGSSNSSPFLPPHPSLSFSGGSVKRSAQTGRNSASHSSTSGLPPCHPAAPSRPLFSVLSQTWILHLVTLLAPE